MLSKKTREYIKLPESYSFYWFYKLSLVFSLSSTRKFYIFSYRFFFPRQSGPVGKSTDTTDSDIILPGVLNGGNFFIEGGKFASQNPQNLEVEHQVYLCKQHGKFTWNFIRKPCHTTQLEVSLRIFSPKTQDS